MLINRGYGVALLKVYVDIVKRRTSLLCGRVVGCGKNLLFRYASVISFSFAYDSKLPIVLFVGQCGFWDGWCRAKR